MPAASKSGFNFDYIALTKRYVAGKMMGIDCTISTANSKAISSMFTTFTALALAGGALLLVLQWQLKKRWEISLSIPQALAGAIVPSILQPFPFPVPLSLTLGLLLPDLLLRRT